MTLNNVTRICIECFSGCQLDKLELPKLEYINKSNNSIFSKKKFNLAKIKEFKIIKVTLSYTIFLEINLNELLKMFSSVLVENL